MVYSGQCTWDHWSARQSGLEWAPFLRATTPPAPAPARAGEKKLPPRLLFAPTTAAPLHIPQQLFEHGRSTTPAGMIMIINSYETVAIIDTWQ